MLISLQKRLRLKALLLRYLNCIIAYQSFVKSNCTSIWEEKLTIACMHGMSSPRGILEGIFCTMARNMYETYVRARGRSTDIDSDLAT